MGFAVHLSKLALIEVGHPDKPSKPGWGESFVSGAGRERRRGPTFAAKVVGVVDGNDMMRLRVF